MWIARCWLDNPHRLDVTIVVASIAHLKLMTKLNSYKWIQPEAICYWRAPKGGSVAIAEGLIWQGIHGDLLENAEVSCGV